MPIKWDRYRFLDTNSRYFCNFSFNNFSESGHWKCIENLKSLEEMGEINLYPECDVNGINVVLKLAESVMDLCLSHKWPMAWTISFYILCVFFFFFFLDLQILVLVWVWYPWNWTRSLYKRNYCGREHWTCTTLKLSLIIWGINLRGQFVSRVCMKICRVD